MLNDHQTTSPTPQLTTWNSTPKIFPHQNLSQKPGHGWKVGPCRKRCKGENAGLEFDSCRRSSVENFPCPKPVGGKPRCFLFQTYLNWWFDLKWRFLKQKYRSVPKVPNYCREIRMFQLALRTYFGIYISKWQGSFKSFQQKFKLASFFWSKGPTFRMKGLFPSCQVRCSDLVVQQLSIPGLVTHHWVIRNHPTLVGP